MVQINFWKTVQELRRFCSTDMKWVPWRTDLIFGKKEEVAGSKQEQTNKHTDIFTG
jgi:hypothetical protein